MQYFRLFLLSSLAFCCLGCQMWAQNSVYPKSVKSLFEQTDAGTRPGGVETPVIAVPDCPEAASLVKSIHDAGASAIIIPKTSDGVVIRDMAASWDGAAIPDGWVNASSAFSALFYKAIADRNIPHTGVSPLSAEIDKGLKRIDDALEDTGALVRKASTFRKARKLMDGMLTIDGHGDLPCCYDEGYELGVRQRNQISLQKMEEGHLSSRVLVSYVRQGELDEESSRKAFAKCDGLIDEIMADIEKNKTWCGQARTPEDALRLKAAGKKAFFVEPSIATHSKKPLCHKRILLRPFSTSKNKGVSLDYPAVRLFFINSINF